MAETLDDVALSVAALSADPVPDTPSAALAAILSGLRRHYTMEAERLAHDRLFPRSETATSLPGPEAQPAMDLDAFML